MQRNRVIRRLLLLLTGWAVFLVLIFSLSRSAATVELLYSRTLYPWISTLLRTFSNIFPFSIQEILLWGGGIYLLHALAVSLYKKNFCLLNTVNSLLAVLLTVMLWFYLSWGLNYYRQPLPVQCGWTKVSQQQHKERFKKVITGTIRELNRLNPEILPPDSSSLDRELDSCYRKAAARLGLQLPGGNTRTKRLFFDFLQLGRFTGVTLPFLHEVHVARDLFNWEYPFVAAHEKAHLFGFARESEANFLGWYASLFSTYEGIRYSSHAALMRYLLGSLSRVDRHKWTSHLSAAVLQRYRATAARSRNRPRLLRRLNTLLYNTYLKSQRVSGGIRNYNQVTRLVLNTPLLPPSL